MHNIEETVDIILAFEKLEGARWAHYLRPRGVAIVNNQALPPLAVSVGREHYPTDEEIKGILKRRTDRVYFIDGTRLSGELGNVRTLNIFMLGCVSLFIPLKVHIWKDSVSRHIPSNIRQINMTAFDQGRKEIGNGHR